MSVGHYQARFETPDGMNHGVITLTSDNKVFGGNNEFMYVGTYQRRGDKFSADVEVTPLFVQISGQLRKNVRKITMEGRGLQDILCRCAASDLPGVEMTAVLARVHV